MNDIDLFLDYFKNKFDGHIAFQDLSFQYQIGEGGFCTVKLGTFKGAQVAIKELNIYDPKRPGSKYLIQEMEILRYCNCGRIVKFYGASLHNNLLYLVLEYVVGETLLKKLTGNQPLINNENIPISMRLKIAHQLIEAIAYLHNLPIKVVHRDITYKNIMISPSYDVKLIDFGISSPFIEYAVTDVGTRGFTAPEVNSGERYDESADIFSYGTVLRCLFGISNQSPFYHLIENCTCFDPQKRLSALNILELLKNNNTPSPSQIQQLLKLQQEQKQQQMYQQQLHHHQVQQQITQPIQQQYSFQNSNQNLHNNTPFSGVKLILSNGSPETFIFTPPTYVNFENFTIEITIQHPVNDSILCAVAFRQMSQNYRCRFKFDSREMIFDPSDPKPPPPSPLFSFSHTWPNVLNILISNLRRDHFTLNDLSQSSVLSTQLKNNCATEFGLLLKGTIANDVICTHYKIF